MRKQGETLLRARGIYEQAEQLGWEDGEGGWTYPVVHSDGSPWLLGQDAIMRFKAYSADKGNKYLWIPSKPRELVIPYYLWDDTLEAIKSRKMVYISSGEPDTLVFRTLGAKNVLSFFGEGNIPADLVELPDGSCAPRLVRDLQMMGAEKVYTYPDRDAQGAGFATRLNELLAGSGIEYHAYVLSAEENSKYDINKLWIDVQFNADAFWEKLALCDEMKFAPVQTPLRTTPRIEREGPELPEDYIRAIVDRLHAVPSKTDASGSENMKCIFSDHEHDKTNPAASWHFDMKTYHCHKCKAAGVGGHKGPGVWLALEVGDRLMLDIRDFRPKKSLPEVRQAADEPLPIVNNGEIADVADTETISDTMITLVNEWAKDVQLVRGMRTGFPKIDMALGGLERNDLCVLLARTGNGKSSLAMQMALKFAEQGPGLFFTTETKPEWFLLRILSHVLQVNGRDLYTGIYQRENGMTAVNTAIEYIRKLPVFWYIRDNPSVDTIVEKSEALKTVKGAKWLIVDSIQNVARPRGDIFTSTEYVMSKLRYCARDLELVTLATCQANRGPADRASKEPLITDAQGGGSIEQNATRFLTLWRPGYDVETHQTKQGEAEMIDTRIAYLNVAKDRNFGAQGTMETLTWEAGKGFKAGDVANVDLREMA